MMMMMLTLLSLPFSLQVDFGSFATILREVAFLMEPNQGQVFYDLGSGTGKAVYVVRARVCLSVGGARSREGGRE